MRYKSGIVGGPRRFRATVEKAVAERRLVFNDRVSRFPNEYCDDVSDMLAY